MKQMFAMTRLSDMQSDMKMQNIMNLEIIYMNVTTTYECMVCGMQDNMRMNVGS